MTKASLGASNLRAEYAAYDLENKTYPRAEEFKSELKKNLKVVSETTFYPFRNYSGKKTVTSDPGQDMPKAFWILPDGSSVGVHINNAKINFYVDTNGPYRKPNRYGFDIFSFAVLDSSDKIKPFKPTRKYTEEELENETWPEVAGHPCDKDSSQGANGMGCSWFAVNDISPDNESQSYWKNLPK